MKKYNLFLFISIFCLSFLFVGCEDDSNPLVGTWNYTEVRVSNCEDGIGDSLTDYSGDGNCMTSNDLTTCTKFSLVLDNENYTINQIVTENGTETVNTLGEGTYKLINTIGSNIQFCTDLICRSEYYTIENGILLLESVNFSNDCVTRTSAVKE